MLFELKQKDPKSIESIKKISIYIPKYYYDAQVGKGQQATLSKIERHHFHFLFQFLYSLSLHSYNLQTLSEAKRRTTCKIASRCKNSHCWNYKISRLLQHVRLTERMKLTLPRQLNSSSFYFQSFSVPSPYALKGQFVQTRFANEFTSIPCVKKSN